MRGMTESNSTERGGRSPDARRLHVVFLDHVARLSGGEIALLRLLPTLAQHVDVTVILGEDGPLVERLRQQDITVEVLPLAPRLRDVRKESVRPTGLDARALAGLPGYVRALRRRIRDLDVDIVHTNSLKSALYGGVAGRLAGKPVVWHIRDRIVSDYLPAPAVGLVRALCLVLPTAVVANSQETLTTIPRRRRRNVVYNAIAPDRMTNFQSTSGRQVDLVIGMIGRLAPWKGQDVFLRAFAEEFRGASTTARVVGSALFGEEAYAESLHALAADLGIGDQVDFRGFREDVWVELHAMDVLVHCSVRPEPFGQVVLEGLAAGVPVVAAAAGGPAELITNEVDGILTKPGDAAELAAALRRLAEDADLRLRIGEAGRRRSLEFTPERTVNRLLEVYAQVLGRPLSAAASP
jgi:glycosyltransferase involved in cell wall biosynthesis